MMIHNSQVMANFWVFADTQLRLDITTMHVKSIYIAQIQYYHQFIFEKKMNVIITLRSRSLSLFPYRRCEQSNPGPANRTRYI